jgi:actin-related protein 6
LHVNNERFMVPEALFSPSDIDLDQAGVCETISNSLRACHPVFRPLLTQNVLLIGSTSSCPGFKKRVVQDLRPMLDADHVMHVNQAADPCNMAWHGGSVWGVSGDFHRLAITKEAYAEQGAHRAVVAMLQ